VDAIAPLDATNDIVSTPELDKSIRPGTIPLTGEKVVVPYNVAFVIGHVMLYVKLLEIAMVWNKLVTK